MMARSPTNNTDGDHVLHRQDHRHQSVCVRFDPPLNVDGCETWQLLRVAKGGKEWGKTRESGGEEEGGEADEARVVEEGDGQTMSFALVAMDSHGDPLYCYQGEKKERDDDEDVAAADHTTTATAAAAAECDKTMEAHDDREAGRHAGDGSTSSRSPVMMMCLAPAEVALRNPLAMGALHLRPFLSSSIVSAEEEQRRSASSSARKNGDGSGRGKKGQTEECGDLLVDHEDESREIGLHHHGILRSPYLWEVERFDGGGVAFSTPWASSSDEQTITTSPGKTKDKTKKKTRHYVTDDGRLCSVVHTGGAPIGFTMRLVFPPVVDVSSLFLQQRADQQHTGYDDMVGRAHDDSASSSIHSDSDRDVRRRTIDALQDAASDCGFFFVILRRRGGEGGDRGSPAVVPAVAPEDSPHLSSFPSTSAPHHHPPPHPPTQLLLKGQDAFSRSGLQWLRKVTLATTTGTVKSMKSGAGEATWGAVADLPHWLTTSTSVTHYSGPADGSRQAGGSDSNNDDMPTLSANYLDGAMEVASHVIGALHSRLGGGSPDTAPSSSSSYLPTPREELFGLLRLICYPPNERGCNERGCNERGCNERGCNERGCNERGCNERGCNERGCNDGAASAGGATQAHHTSAAAASTADADAVYARPGHAVVHEGDRGTVLASHTDKTWLTLLAAAPSLEGLDVIDCDGETFTPVRTPHWVERTMANSMAAMALGGQGHPFSFAKEEKEQKDGDDVNNCPKTRECVRVGSTKVVEATAGGLKENETTDGGGEDYIVWLCNIGDAFQMASRGKYLSREHRARNATTTTTTTSSTPPTAAAAGADTFVVEDNNKNKNREGGVVCSSESTKSPIPCARVSLPLFVEPRGDLWPTPYLSDAVKIEIL